MLRIAAAIGEGSGWEEQHEAGYIRAIDRAGVPYAVVLDDHIVPGVSLRAEYYFSHDVVLLRRDGDPQAPLGHAAKTMSDVAVAAAPLLALAPLFPQGALKRSAWRQAAGLASAHLRAGRGPSGVPVARGVRALARAPARYRDRGVPLGAHPRRAAARPVPLASDPRVALRAARRVAARRPPGRDIVDGPGVR